MTANRDLESILHAHFEMTADRTIADRQVDAIAAATVGRRQRPAWLASLRSLLMSTTPRPLARPTSTPVLAVLLILVLLVAIAGAAVATGRLHLGPAPVVNGPIIFGRYNAALDDTVIYTMRADGSSPRVLLSGRNECPQISPDGRRVAVGFGVVDIDGSNRRVFSKAPGDVNLGCGTWSPDGKRLAVEGFNDQEPSVSGVFLVDSTDGSNPVRLTTNGIGGNDVPGDFSPDGKHVSFVRGIAGQERGTIWVADIEGGAARQVSTREVGLGTAWSPAGDWIVATAISSFVLARPDGSDVRVLNVPADVRWVGGPSFSPDGQRLVFNMAVGESDKNDIYTMTIDGTDLVQLTNTPNANEYVAGWGVDPA
jgi:Tol biopolymer transport system component